MEAHHKVHEQQHEQQQQQQQQHQQQQQLQQQQSIVVVVRSPSTTFKCTHDGCVKWFGTASKLQRHRKTHLKEKRFKCTHAGCDSAFTRNEHLTAHCRKHAAASSPSAPPVNNSASATTSFFPRQQQLPLTPTPQYVCDYASRCCLCTLFSYHDDTLGFIVMYIFAKDCGKKFKYESNLATHRRQQHAATMAMTMPLVTTVLPHASAASLVTQLAPRPSPTTTTTPSTITDAATEIGLFGVVDASTSSSNRSKMVHVDLKMSNGNVANSNSSNQEPPKPSQSPSHVADEKVAVAGEVSGGGGGRREDELVLSLVESSMGAADLATAAFDVSECVNVAETDDNEIILHAAPETTATSTLFRLKGNQQTNQPTIGKHRKH